MTAQTKISAPVRRGGAEAPSFLPRSAPPRRSGVVARAFRRDWFAARGWQHPPASVGADRPCRAGGNRAAGRADRRRQDPGGLPAQPDRPGRQAQARRARARLHTLYISPLKALAVDVARNLEAPIAEMGLAVTVETRTGDTPAARRQRQRHAPPDILLTTPEQLALLLAASARAADVRESARPWCWTNCTPCYNSKRGDLLALGLARLADAGARPSPRRPVGHGGRSRAAAALSGAAAAGRRSAVASW